MRLPRQDLLDGAAFPDAMNALINSAEEVLRTWQPAWSDFLSAAVREEALSRLGHLSEVTWHSDGGYAAAERQRLFCMLRDQERPSDVPIQGLMIEGNFLFDPLSPQDLRQALLEMGAKSGELGDLWVRGDRGGQGLCSPALATVLHERNGKVRDVDIRCEALAIEQLQLPVQRAVRMMQTVEASCRLDAIASAGFGLSRAKIVDHVKQGRLRLNWKNVRQPSRELTVGDRLHLQDRGSLEVTALNRTKRDRWRVGLKRS